MNQVGFSFLGMFPPRGLCGAFGMSAVYQADTEEGRVGEEMRGGSRSTSSWPVGVRSP